MKIFSKFILTVLCANLTFGCFAGNVLGGERAREREQRELREKVASIAAIAAAGYALYKLFDFNDDDSDDDREQPVAQPTSNAIESRNRAAREQKESSGCIQESACRISKDESLDYPCIKLADNKINGLKEQFDNKLMTPSSWGPSKNITFDYQHIFGSKRKGQIFQMGHADAHNILYNHKPQQLLSIKFTGYGPCESYGYSWDNNKRFNTFFPDNWPANKVMSKIKEAIKSGMTTIEQKPTSIVCRGKTNEGLMIEIVFKAKNGNPTGKIKSAYPIID